MIEAKVPYHLVPRAGFWILVLNGNLLLVLMNIEECGLVALRVLEVEERSDSNGHLDASAKATRAFNTFRLVLFEGIRFLHLLLVEVLGFGTLRLIFLRDNSLTIWFLRAGGVRCTSLLNLLHIRK